ncbi:TerB family tellurite resistance protein [Maricaulis sp.]|uniref:TerB family tellurite resistance protein n=1 Tax=Maricaulis sp. TaxID=1486257 RepID=UPI00263401B6|nr:TerB family tellurite resistance protein [Maricaulis sp.]
MHILLGLVGAIAAIGIWIYRIRAAADAASQVADLAGEAANLPRKMRFRSKARRNGLDVIDDPREAATVLMLCIVRVDGEVTAAHKEAIAGQMVTRFELDRDASEEILARASWHVSELVDETNAINKMVDFIIERVGRDEMPALMQMLEAAASIDGEPSAYQQAYIKRCRMRAGLH